MAGVVVELYDGSGSFLGTEITDSGGAYAFLDVPPGQYFLVFREPAGYCFTVRDQGDDDEIDSDVDPQALTTSVFTLSEGENDLSLDAGLVPDASIGNRVWLDDGDGLQAGGEPGVAGVNVDLHDASGPLLESTITDSSGAYAFSPGPGDYFLRFHPPAGTVFAPRDAGDDEADSDVFEASGTTSVFSLGAGEVDTSRDAGLEVDSDGDGVPDRLDRCRGDDATGDEDGDLICADQDCNDQDASNGCSVFSDGFESGDTSAWSLADP